MNSEHDIINIYKQQSKTKNKAEQIKDFLSFIDADILHLVYPPFVKKFAETKERPRLQGVLCLSLLL